MAKKMATLRADGCFYAEDFAPAIVIRPIESQKQSLTEYGVESGDRWLFTDEAKSEYRFKMMRPIPMIAPAEYESADRLGAALPLWENAVKCFDQATAVVGKSGVKVPLVGEDGKRLYTVIPLLEGGVQEAPMAFLRTKLERGLSLDQNQAMGIELTRQAVEAAKAEGRTAKAGAKRETKARATKEL